MRKQDLRPIFYKKYERSGDFVWTSGYYHSMEKKISEYGSEYHVCLIEDEETGQISTCSHEEFYYAPEERFFNELHHRELRSVKYEDNESFGNARFTDFADLTEVDEPVKEPENKYGFFHAWEKVNSGGNESLYAWIEDMGTGEMIRVSAEKIKFLID